MVARTISARRRGATPRLGLTAALVYLIGRPIIFTRADAVKRSAGRGRRALDRAGAAARRSALGVEPLEVDQRVIGEGHRRGDGRMTLGDQAVHRLADAAVRGMALRGGP